MIKGKGINVSSCKEEKFAYHPTKEALKFGIAGGVAAAVKKYLGKDAEKVKEEVISGLDKKAIYKLKAYTKGHCKANLIEVMACSGGCIGGGSTFANADEASKKIDIYAKKAGK